MVGYQSRFFIYITIPLILWNTRMKSICHPKGNLITLIIDVVLLALNKLIPACIVVACMCSGRINLRFSPFSLHNSLVYRKYYFTLLFSLAHGHLGAIIMISYPIRDFETCSIKIPNFGYQQRGRQGCWCPWIQNLDMSTSSIQFMLIRTLCFFCQCCLLGATGRTILAVMAPSCATYSLLADSSFSCDTAHHESWLASFHNQIILHRDHYSPVKISVGLASTLVEEHERDPIKFPDDAQGCPQWWFWIQTTYKVALLADMSCLPPLWVFCHSPPAFPYPANVYHHHTIKITD
jgi:hypothetical protein